MSSPVFRSSASLVASWWLMCGVAGAATFQYEVLGLSEDWIVVRENVPASPADTAGCEYPGIDPSEYAAVRVYFVPLSAEAKRGRVVLLARSESPIPVYDAGGHDQPCTSDAQARKRWDDVTARAKSLGIALPAAAAKPVVLGNAVRADACAVIGSSGTGAACRQVFRSRLQGRPIRIGVSLAATPESPDERICQFIGHRFVAVLQVAGTSYGTIGTIAPGGVAEHYDCRSQVFQPLRLYDLGPLAAIVGGFRGTSLADREEYPFVLVFPARPAP